MTFLEAAIEVLKICQRPMTSGEITEEALKRGFLASSGKPPSATMSATLYTYLNREGPKRLVRLHMEGSSPARRGSVRWPLSGSRTGTQADRLTFLLAARG
jgi:HB1, ASXL, restriction endonuclease HTH domain